MLGLGFDRRPRRLGQGRVIRSSVLVDSPLSTETVDSSVGRYAADRDARVMGVGGGGSRRREGNADAMLPGEMDVWVTKRDCACRGKVSVFATPQGQLAAGDKLGTVILNGSGGCKES